MVKKKELNTYNFLTALGRPVFKSLIFFISLLAVVFLFIEKLFSVKINIKFPSLRFSKLKFPKLRLPKISFPHIVFSKLRLPKFVFPKFFINLDNIIKKTPSIRFILVGISFVCLITFIYIEIFMDLPNPSSLSTFPSKLTTQILDRNGKLLYKIYKDENRTLINLSSLPDYVKNAFLAAEDKDFYNHNGFSLTGLLRAFYKDIFDDHLEGGSTITQQLVKNTILSPEKTITRKIKEIILAVWIEKLYNKDTIFEMYLNQVGFGGPAYGIQEAARQYFDADAKDLDLAQAAFLAGLTRAPSKYSPYGDEPDLAISRQQWVLNQMYKDGFISEADLKKTLGEKLMFRSGKIEIKAPHFVMLIKSLLEKQLGENIVSQGGLKVYTTLDSDLQDYAQKIVTGEVQTLKQLRVNNGAALVTDPKTGEVLAMIGSKDYFDLNQNGQVNLTTSLRQPGSSIKPLNYALYFEHGNSPSNLIEDHPIDIHIAGQADWIPKNYDGKFHGLIPIRQALASSYNIPSVLVLMKNGTTDFASFAKTLGINTWNDPGRYGLSMALGSLEVRMTDLATAYSTFANMGFTVPLKTIEKIEKPNGEELHIPSCLGNLSSESNTESDCTSHKTISPLTAYLISDILSDNSARAPAFGANSVLNIKSAKVAVKTGTSNDLKDNWAIGYTQNFLVATWVGNNDNTPMSHIASGITGASPIWAKIFAHILENHQEAKEFTLPDNLVKVSICSLTGTLGCNGCPNHTEYFIKGTEPKTACDPADIARRLHPTLPQDAPTSQIF